MQLYLDLVVILNFLVDILLILGTNRLAGHPAGIKRGALAALVGGVYSGVCMIPGFTFLANTLWRFVSLALMSITAFGWSQSALQRGTVFVLLSMALGGIALGLTVHTFWMLVLASGMLWLLCRAGFRGNLGERSYVDVELRWGEQTVRLTALRDTGNVLKDSLSGERVLVAGADVAQELLGLTQYQLSHPVETVSAGVLPGLRLIPYRAVGQPSGMLLALRLPGSRVGNKRRDPIVAFAPQVLSRGGGYRMLTGGDI